MPAPIGNTNAQKGRMWNSAIKSALEERSKGDQMAALRELAGVLLDNCAEGDMQALKELGDRLDGKAAQALALTGADGGPIVERIERVIVDHSNN